MKNKRGLELVTSLFLGCQICSERFVVQRCITWPFWCINPFSANFTKWSNTLKQFFGNLPTNCWSVFDHFVGLTLKGLIQRGFWVIPKILIDNLNKSFHGVIIIQFSTSSLNLKMLDKNEENYKIVNISRTKRVF